MKSFQYRIITPATVWLRRFHGYVAAGLLAVMFGLGITSLAADSAIVDEVAHIPAAYSYLHYGDFRLNPEHPPLIKDLAGIPLQFMNLKFPDKLPAWTTEVNGQWESGWNFLYHIGNDADPLIFWARVPILLLAIGFGVVLYWLVRRRWGTAVGLVTLLFYTLSPNILAHARFVTTDLGATVFFFLAIVTFARFVGAPTRKNFLLLSLGLAGAQLAKFSAVLLFPLLGVMSLVLIWTHLKPGTKLGRLKTYTGGLIAASALSVVWVWIFYIPHTLMMPEPVQDRLISGSIYDGPLKPVAGVLVSVNDTPIMKPLVQYVLGVAMVYNRVKGGNVTYFNGEVTNQSFHWYFPELFLVKTQIPLLLLMGLASWYGFWLLRRRPQAWPEKLKRSLRGHVLEWTLGTFAVFYFAISVAGNLNLGIRHILPIYVPIFLLAAIGSVKLLRRLAQTRFRVSSRVVFAALLLWYGGSTVTNHPHYVAYFNEFIGGPANSGAYFSDSSVDWGQDLRRLRSYVEAHPEIDTIAVDYFGGGDPKYYFCDRRYDTDGNLVADATGYDCSRSRYREWHSHFGKYTGQYIAVSETFLQNDRYYSALNGTPGYDYLRAMKPITTIGYSIYIYKLY